MFEAHFQTFEDPPPIQTGARVQELRGQLTKLGVDGFILETFIDMCELRLTVEAVRAVSDLPILVSKAYIEDGEMLAEGLPMRCTREMMELGVTAVGGELEETIDRAYRAVEKIGFDGAYYRSDIGKKGLERLRQLREGGDS